MKKKISEEIDLWRGRMKKKMDKKNIQSYISSLEEDKKIVDIDIDVGEAHCLMLYKKNYVNKKEISLILRGFEKARERFKKNLLFKEINTESFNDIHPVIEKYVIKCCGIDIGGKVHMAKSRNDQIVTDIRISLRNELIEIIQRLLDLCKLFISTAEKNTRTIMPGYTHTQGAQIITYSHYLISYIDLFLRDIERLFEIYRRINLSPLGCGALSGTTFKIDRIYTANLLGFDGVLENTLDGVSNRDFMLETASGLGIVMVNLSRIAEDLILFSTGEFSLIELSDDVCDISTAMPHKKNPDVLEILRAKTSLVIGEINKSYAIMKGIPTGYNRDMQELKLPLWEITETVKSSIEVIKDVFRTLKVNHERMIEISKENFLTATELTELIVKKTGLNFREVNYFVGNIVKECIKQNISFSKLTVSLIEDIAEKTLKRKISLSDEDISFITEPEKVIEEKNNIGHPAPDENKRMIKDRNDKIQKKGIELELIRKRLKQSNGILKRKVLSLIK